jgi:hypothetical protein
MDIRASLHDHLSVCVPRLNNVKRRMVQKSFKKYKEDSSKSRYNIVKCIWSKSRGQLGLDRLDYDPNKVNRFRCANEKAFASFSQRLYPFQNKICLIGFQNFWYSQKFFCKH